VLPVKPCHQALRQRSRFFGLEPLDVLMLAPGFYLCSVVLGRPMLAVVTTLVGALVLRLIKWGRLPGYTLSLALYLLLPEHHAALGYDRAPRFPRV